LRKAFLIFLFLSVCFNFFPQQNLIPNGSFEDTLKCPQTGGEITASRFWFDPNFMSSDLFNSCSSGGFSIPYNQFGYQFPYQGTNFAGLTLFWKSVSNYREYVGIMLKESLKPEEVYYFSLQFSYADSCTFISKNISIGFVEDTSGLYNQNIILPNSKFLLYQDIIDEKNSWNKAKILFTAKGGEKFILIGNFENDLSTNFVSTTGGNSSIFDFSYIYLDSISLYHSEIIIPNVFTPNDDGINDVWKVDLSEYKNPKVNIFNRWGISIFGSTFHKINWDGRTSSGIECSSGIYFFTIQADNIKKEGFIQLIR
jgi:gliding motility-associated-like protein